MKRLALTFAIVLGLSLTSFAEGGGLFKRGAEEETEQRVTYHDGYFRYFDIFRGNRDDILPGLPDHDDEENTDAPLGGGALLLIGFGAAYALKKRNEK